MDHIIDGYLVELPIPSLITNLSTLPNGPQRLDTIINFTKKNFNEAIKKAEGIE